MPVSVKVGGAWKTATAVFNKVGGVWKTAADMPVKIAGVWKTGILASSSFESIATATGTGSSNIITFNSIPNTFSALQLRGQYSTNGWTVDLTFNSDTGTNYARHRLRGNGTAASASGSASRANIDLDSGGSGSGQHTGIVLDIHDYASTSKNKTVRILSGQELNAAGGRIDLFSGLWISTSAITSITLTAQNSEPFTTSSVFSLYGIKGA